MGKVWNVISFKGYLLFCERQRWSHIQKSHVFLLAKLLFCTVKSHTSIFLLCVCVCVCVCAQLCPTLCQPGKLLNISSVQFSSVTQSCLTLSTPWNVAHKASLSITNSCSLLGVMSIETYHLILYCPLLLDLQSFPASGSFPGSQFFASGGQSTGASASASVLPMNIQDWFPLGLTGLISWKSKGPSRVFSNTTA